MNTHCSWKSMRLVRLVLLPGTAGDWIAEVHVKGLISFLSAALVVFGLCAASFWLGAVVGRFETNLCWSGVVADVSAQVGQATQAADQSLLARLAEKLEGLPLRGYESDCDEVSAAAL